MRNWSYAFFLTCSTNFLFRNETPFKNDSYRPLWKWLNHWFEKKWSQTFLHTNRYCWGNNLVCFLCQPTSISGKIYKMTSCTIASEFYFVSNIFAKLLYITLRAVVDGRMYLYRSLVEIGFTDHCTNLVESCKYRKEQFTALE